MKEMWRTGVCMWRTSKCNVSDVRGGVSSQYSGEARGGVVERPPSTQSAKTGPDVRSDKSTQTQIIKAKKK